MRILNNLASLKPEILFVVIALFFGTLSVFLVPQLSVNDEGAHLYRSYSLSTGDIDGHHCSYPQEIINKVKESSKGIYSFDLSQESSPTLKPHACGSAGSYYPIMHLPQSVGIFISKVIHDSPALMVLMGRMANLLFFVTAMYFIIRFAAVGKWVFFVISLLPISIHTAASLSYDTFNTVAILAFVCMILNLFGQKTNLTKKQITLLAVLSLFVAVAKTSNLVLLLLLFALPRKLFEKTIFKRSIINKLVITLGISVASLVSIVIWQKISGNDLANTPLSNKVQDNPFYFLAILYNTYINPFFGYNDVVVRGVVGEFSSFKYHLPTFLVVLSYGLIAFSLLLKNKSEESYLKISLKPITYASTAVFTISLLVITYGLYALWATLPYRLGSNAFYADGVQGRYFTPLLALLIPLGIWMRKYILIATSSPKISQGIIVTTSILLLVFYSIQTFLFINR